MCNAVHVLTSRNSGSCQSACRHSVVLYILQVINVSILADTVTGAWMARNERFEVT